MHHDDCCGHHDHRHYHLQGHPWPYDPTRHHHPNHPPYMVDRCAEECDDQLPLFAQVGRGLRGDGYKVMVQYDDLDETYLEGLIYDAHTGALVSDWKSENINGGHLSYQYNLRPSTDPQTFTITFKYMRPGRNANERGVVWSWTTPAIPYLWSRQEDGSMSDGEDIVGTGVATLYLKKTSEPEWDWRKHEKLVYPEGFTHEDMHAPDPEKGWTVNLQYGIGGDIDAPNAEDFAKVLGISIQNIKNIILNSPEPTDTIPDDSLKKYIDRRDQEVTNLIRYYDVNSAKPGALKVNKSTDEQTKTTTFLLTPIAPTAGRGISVDENPNTGKVTIGNNISAGAGIAISNGPNNSLVITNSMAATAMTGLRYGTDYTSKCYNEWFFGPSASSSTKQPSVPTDRKYPTIRAHIDRDASNNIVFARISVMANISDDRALIFASNLKDEQHFLFHHADLVKDVPLSHILGITFLGDYAPLNSMTPANISSNDSIWNVLGSNDYDQTNPTWHACGASWAPNLSVTPKSEVPGKSESFIIAAANIPDGYNSQYSRPPYGYATLCTRGWANFNLSFDLY